MVYPFLPTWRLFGVHTENTHPTHITCCSSSTRPLRLLYLTVAHTETMDVEQGHYDFDCAVLKLGDT
jgi:hypothetical protein